MGPPRRGAQWGRSPGLPLTDAMSYPAVAASCAATRACALEASGFFLAWQGVLVLTFTGWPPPLARLKQELNESQGLQAEGAGSRWPKCTLAATRDGAPPLTLAQLSDLRALCFEHSAALRCLAAGARSLPVSALGLCTYQWRCLEAAGAPQVQAMPLAEPVDPSPPTEAEAARVAATLGEWEGDLLAQYLDGANRAGSRLSSYREASPPGATLVAFLGGAWLRGALEGFAGAVEALLPGRFAFLQPSSLCEGYSGETNTAR